MSRGQQYEKTILDFIKNNFNENSSKSKQSHSFLYCINGSGYGKTWTGYYISNRIRRKQQYSRPIISCCLDFYNGSKWLTHIDEDPSVALGIRVAAVVIFKCKLSDLIGNIKREELPLFTFRNVMKWISDECPRTVNSKIIMFVLHLDELQTNPEMAQKLLHVIGDYMCSTESNVISNSVEDGIVVYPVITGTSSKGFKQEVTGYGVFHIKLSPFNYKESLEFLGERKIVYYIWQKQMSFKRLIKCCGGIPRFLEYVSKLLEKEDKDKPLSGTDVIFQNLSVSLSRAYKFENILDYIGGDLNIFKQIIALSINAIPITQTMKLKDTTIEDIVKTGIVFISPTQNDDTGYYYFVIPLIILYCWNITWKIFPVSLDLLLKKDWDWKSFESWDCSYQLVKNNSCYWLTQISDNFKANLALLYNSMGELKHQQIHLCEMKDLVVEGKQFLKADGESHPENIITTTSGMTINSSDFVFYSFRCLTGNPSVDGRTFHLPHESDKNEKAWMICKQYKHSTQNKKISVDTINNSLTDWKKRIRNYEENFRCVLVIVTNERMTAQEIEEFQQKEPNLIINCLSNFGYYCPITFSAYSIFDDDEDQTVEELLFRLPERKEEDSMVLEF